MADKSKIEWTDATWNPITGCTQISEGCEHCYAKRHAERFRGRFGYPAEDPFRVTFHRNRLSEPLRWNKSKKVFVCSMGDIFHDDISDNWLDAVFSVIAVCGQEWHRARDGYETLTGNEPLQPKHIFMILTKRPDRMQSYLSSPGLWDRWMDAMDQAVGWWGLSEVIDVNRDDLGFLPNVWLGVTAENQRTADERIPILLQTPAAVRFVSVEPMLERVDVWQWLGGNRDIKPPHKYNGGLNWVICGGESGPGARPMHPEWARSLRDQCVNAGVPFFFKQWGEWAPEDHYTPGMANGRHEEQIIVDFEHSTMSAFKVGKKAAGRLLDGREWNEWPEVKA